MEGDLATDARSSERGPRSGPAPVALGLGSNVGDRRAAIDAAVAHLRARGAVTGARLSSWYETEPIGPDQPWFLNRVLVGSTGRTPVELLADALAVERELGRTRRDGDRWGPRTIDIDLLAVGDLSVRTEELVLPHPEIAARRFVLVPWAELEPDRLVPAGPDRPEDPPQTVGALLAALDAAGDRSEVRRRTAAEVGSGAGDGRSA